MATASKGIVTRFVSVEEEGYILNLNESEARALCAVIGKIGGDNELRHIFSDRPESILRQLRNAGLRYDYLQKESLRLKGSLYFHDTVEAAEQDHWRS